VKQTLKPINAVRPEFAQVCDGHQARGFRVQELLERQSQPSGNLCRNIFNLPHRDLFSRGPSFAFDRGIQPPQGFGTSQIKVLTTFNRERVAVFDRPYQAGMRTLFYFL
jgi:hypothetical protein